MLERSFVRTLASVMSIACVALLQAQATQPNQRSGLEDFREVIKKAKDKVFPAVVFIKCIRERYERGEKSSSEVSGSGVIISTDGEVLTNWHVVDKASEIRCLLLDGRALDALIVGQDKDLDLALLKLEKKQDTLAFPYAELGDSSTLHEGDFVMAMGAPWGLNRSVSIGIISCATRFLPTNSEYSLWLQSDASISPGNSGGPLVNTRGQIVGINALGVRWGGGMGFSIPSNTITEILPQLREHGYVRWSWTGLRLQPIKDFNKNMYFEATEGVIVSGTDPGSPARSAGIQTNDRIVRVNGTPVNALFGENLPAVRRMLGLLPKHKPARFEIFRHNDLLAIDLIPREKGEVEGREVDCPRWDFTVKSINKFDDPDLYFHRKQGVYIFGIKHPGNAVSSGLRQHDIILKIDETEISTLAEARAIHKSSLDNLGVKHQVIFTILRNGLKRQFVLDYSRDFEKR